MDSIFALWPSVAALASDIGEPYPTVNAWKQRGSIPAKHDIKLVSAAEARGIALSYEKLADARAEAAERRKLEVAARREVAERKKDDAA